MNEEQKQKRREYNKKYRDKNPDYNKEYYSTNKEGIASSGKKYREENKDRLSKSRKKYNLKNKYGITLDEVNDRYAEQNGCCAICRNPITNPYVDHCHETGEVRGLLCHQCNIGLGMFKDNIAYLENAIKYLIIYKSEDK